MFQILEHLPKLFRLLNCWLHIQTLGRHVIMQGKKIHSSALIVEWILERTSDSSQSARPTGRVLKSAGETSVF